MGAIVVESTILGLVVSLICVILSVLIQIASSIAILSPVQYKYTPLLSKVFLLSTVPGIVLHPAIIIFFLVGLDTYGDNGDTISLIWNSNTSILSFIVIATFLHFPLAFLHVHSFGVNALVRQWQSANIAFAIPKVKSLIKFVLFPLLLKSLPFMLFLMLVVEGMVFLPYLHQSGKTTVGRLLLENAIGAGGTVEFSSLLFIIFLVKVAVSFIIYKIIEKQELYWRNRFISLSLNMPSWLLRAFNSIVNNNKILLSLSSLFILPVLLIDAYIVYSLFDQLVGGLTSLSISDLYDALADRSYGVPIIDAARNTFTIAFISSMLCVFVFVVIIRLSGSKDSWVIGKNTKHILTIGSAFASVPLVVYAYTFSEQLVTNSIFTIGFLFVFLGLIYAVLIFGHGAALVLFRHELFRCTLGFGLVQYWKTFFLKLIPDLVVVFVFVYALLWNDTVVQMFAQSSFKGLPPTFAPLGRDGLTLEISAGVSLIQLVTVSFIFLPTWIALRKVMATQ
jgi:hypothetical protein